MQEYYAIYSRKSKFTGKGESIENQIELCRNQIISKYGSDSANKILIYQDEGFTGYNTNRPQFKKMMYDIRDKKIKTVVVYRLDRISRNVSDFCDLKDEFNKYNVGFMSVTENFDTTSPMGTAMLMITSVFAQLERDTIAERIRDNMYELAKTGRWLGGTTPLGFKSERVENVSIDGKKRSLYKLVTIDEEVKIVKLIWDKMLELKGLGKLESYLLRHGIKTRNGNNFTRFSLINILKNPVYVVADSNIKNFFESMGVIIYGDDKDFDGKQGLMAYNKRYEVPGKSKTVKDISEWIIAVGKHEGVIPSVKFIETWSLIHNNRDKRFRTPSVNTSILSGIIRCKYCGSYMRPRMRQTINANGQRNFTYICELKDKSRKQLCQCKNINGIETDKIVIDIIKKLTMSTSDFMMIFQNIANGREKETTKRQNELVNLNMTLSKNKMKMNRLIEKLSVVDKEIVPDIANGIKELKNKINEIEKRIVELRQLVMEDIDQAGTAKLASDIIERFMNNFDTLDLISKRTLVRLLVKSVESDGKNIYIDFIKGDENCP